MSIRRCTPVTTAQCDLYWSDYKRFRTSWTRELAAENQRDCQKFFDRELRQPPSLLELARRIVNQCVTVLRVTRLSELNLPKCLEEQLRTFMELDCFYCYEVISHNLEHPEAPVISDFSIITYIRWNNEVHPPELISREIWKRVGKRVDWKYILLSSERFRR